MLFSLDSLNVAFLLSLLTGIIYLFPWLGNTVASGYTCYLQNSCIRDLFLCQQTRELIHTVQLESTEIIPPVLKPSSDITSLVLLKLTFSVSQLIRLPNGG